jgi:hypothetical protein
MDKVLAARLTRGDQLAIPTMVEKLATDTRGYWWQFGRKLWSPALSHALDAELLRRSAVVKREWGETAPSDWITSEILQRRTTDEAEQLLLKHWDSLRFSARFLQTALYVCTPRLVEAARDTLAACPTPAVLLHFLESHWGLRTKGRPGLTCETQVRALAPHFGLLSAMDIRALWDACNDRGWFAVRDELLDGLLTAPFDENLWSPDRFSAELDGMVTGKRAHLLEHRIEDFLRSGVPWPEIVETLSSWLERRPSVDALRIVAAALAHRGTRADLITLATCEASPGDAARKLVADTTFAVRRRHPH